MNKDEIFLIVFLYNLVISVGSARIFFTQALGHWIMTNVEVQNPKAVLIARVDYFTTKKNKLNLKPKPLASSPVLDFILFKNEVTTR